VVVTVRNDPRPLPSRAGATLRGYDSAGLYGVTSAARATVRAITKDYGLREVSAWPIAALRVHCIVFRVPEDALPVQMIAALARDPRVDSAQPLNQFATETEGEESAYNDPYAGLQTVLRDLTVEQAQHWSRGAGVRIAIIDTGVDVGHPDLAGQSIERRNFVDADDAAFRRDRHGTAVVGVISAVPDNHIGIVGIAPDAHLFALKACWQLPQSGLAAACNRHAGRHRESESCRSRRPAARTPVAPGHAARHGSHRSRASGGCARRLSNGRGRRALGCGR